MRVGDLFKFFQSRLSRDDVVQSDRTPYPGRLIFDHLPKTGGQAIYTWLVSELGNRTVGYVNNFDESVNNIIRLYGGRHSILCGHLIFPVGAKLDTRYQYVTILREPVDRTLSWIYYLLNDKHSGGLRNEFISGARDFMESEGDVASPLFISSINNPYVTHFSAIGASAKMDRQGRLEQSLSILRKYSLVGIYEEMDEFIGNFAGLVGIPVPEKLRVVNKTSRRRPVGDISKKLRTKIMALNDLDIVLYKKVCKSGGTGSITAKQRRAPPVRSNWVKEDEPTAYLKTVPGLTIELVSPKLHSTHVRGENMTFELKFTMAKMFSNPYLCLHIVDTERRRVYASNSALLGSTKDISGPGTYMATFALDANFPIGRYYIGFVFIERTPAGERELAWYDVLSEFDIISIGDVRLSGYCPNTTVFAVAQEESMCLPSTEFF